VKVIIVGRTLQEATGSGVKMLTAHLSVFISSSRASIQSKVSPLISSFACTTNSKAFEVFLSVRMSVSQLARETPGATENGVSYAAH
jgi:hypothetical protein